MQDVGKTLMVMGRIIWTCGELFKGRGKVIYGTTQPKLNAAGEQSREYGFGLAVPFANIAEVWQSLHEQAYTLHPSQVLPPGFAMKYKNGGGTSNIDDKGQPYDLREGYAGHLVLACTMSMPIKFFKFDAALNKNEIINEGIKCGDYVNVQLNIVPHGPVGQGKPGLYLNPNAVQFVGYGKEIISAPSGDAIFGNTAPPLVSGASATPLAPPTTGMTTPPPGAPAPTAAMPTPATHPPIAAPAPVAQVPPPVVPNYQVIPQTHQPAAVAQPAMPAIPSVPATPAVAVQPPIAQAPVMPQIPGQVASAPSLAPVPQGIPQMPGVPQ